MTGPTLNVSIITYNQRAFIARAIDSALAQQTDFPVTIHIGDDYSDDGTRDILRDYHARYPGRIVLNLQPRRPGGIPGRVNNITNLQSCTGDYIALLDGDDYWIDPGKLQEQVDFLERSPRHGGAAHGCVKTDTLDTLLLDDITQPDAPPTDLVAADIFDRQSIQTSTFVIRRDLLDTGPWFSDVHSADYALFLMAARHGPIRFDPRIRSVYQQHPGSVTDGRGTSDWARTFLHDWPLIVARFPQAVSFRQEMNLLRANRIAARSRGHYLKAMIYAAKLMAKDPAAIARWFKDARK